MHGEPENDAGLSKPSVVSAILASNVCLAAAAIAIVGGTLSAPYFIGEWSRLPWWEILVTSTGELVAIAWFVYILFALLLTGKTYDKFSGRPIDPVAANVMICLVFGGLFFDIGASYLLARRELSLSQTSERGTLRLVEARTFTTDGHKEFACFARGEIVDRNGSRYSTFCYFERAHFEIPDPERDNVVAGQLPCTYTVFYDPSFPRRFWRRSHEERNMGIYLTSTMMGAFQFFAALIILYIRMAGGLMGIAAIEIGPFLGLAIYLLICGLFMLKDGETALWPFL